MSHITILLVDDEEDIRTVLGMALTDLGYDVMTASNGKEGLRLFRQHQPPIVVTDIKMPDIDGVTLLKRIKSENPDVEVVMITGHGDMDVAIQSFQHEAIDFITKPIDVNDLESALNRVHEKITAREKQRNYTESLESLIHQKSEIVTSLEKMLGEASSLQHSTVAQRFQSLFDDLPCHVAVIDDKLILTAANKKLQRDFGLVGGMPCYRALKQQEEPCSECPVKTTFATGESQEGETEIINPDGDRYNVLLWTAPVRTGEDRITHALTLFTEMAQIQKVQDHLSSMGLLVGSISHSIKGLLTGLDGGMYLLDRGLQKEDVDQIQEGLQLVKQMASRIRNIVLDVLLFSKDRDLKKDVISVADFLIDIGQIIEAKIREHQIEFTTDCDPSAGDFVGDMRLLRAALVNVLENAVDACAEDERGTAHRVEVKARGDAKSVSFEISDNGVGMDEETRQNMCNLFFSSKGQKGTGLGLYITKRTILQHRGEMHVESQPGKGTRFLIRLPRTFWVPNDRIEPTIDK